MFCSVLKIQYKIIGPTLPRTELNKLVSLNIFTMVSLANLTKWSTRHLLTHGQGSLRRGAGRMSSKCMKATVP